MPAAGRSNYSAFFSHADSHPGERTAGIRHGNSGGLQSRIRHGLLSQPIRLADLPGRDRDGVRSLRAAPANHGADSMTFNSPFLLVIAALSATLAAASLTDHRTPEVLARPLSSIGRQINGWSASTDNVLLERI